MLIILTRSIFSSTIAYGAGAELLELRHGEGGEDLHSRFWLFLSLKIFKPTVS